MTTFGFRSEAAKKAALANETLFSVAANMGSCKLEVVAEIPVPASGDLSFKLQFFVHHDTDEETINKGLASSEVGNEIVGQWAHPERQTLLRVVIAIVCRVHQQAQIEWCMLLYRPCA